MTNKMACQFSPLVLLLLLMITDVGQSKKTCQIRSDISYNPEPTTVINDRFDERIFNNRSRVLDMFCERLTSCMPNRCGRIGIRGSRRQCSCDENCVRFADCCHDYHTQCLLPDKQSEPTTAKTVCISTQGEAGFYLPPINRGSATGISIIQSCPAEFTDTFVKERCVNFANFLEMGNIRRALKLQLPVSHEHFVYRNMYCALCNHVESEELRFWTVKVHSTCLVNGSNTLEDFNATDTFQAIDVAVRQKCPVEFRCPSDTCSKNRRCLLNVISNCHESAPNFLKHQCSSYAHYLRVHDTIYKNPHCALCNGLKSLDIGEKPPHQNRPIIPPTIGRPNQFFNPQCSALNNPNCPNVPNFYLLLDFNSIFSTDTKSTNECKDERCCPEGMRVSYLSSTELSCTPSVTKSTRETHMFLEVLETNHTDTKDLRAYVTQEFPEILKHFLEKAHKVKVGKSGDMNVGAHMLRTLYKYSTKKEQYMPVFIMSVKVHFYHAVNLLQEQLPVDDIFSEMEQNRTNFPMSGTLMKLLQVGETSLTDSLNCTDISILLHENEYKALSNNTILLLRSNKELGQGEFERADSDIFVCLEDVQDDSVVATRIDQQGNLTWLGILTLALIIPSIICLAIAIFTYSIFSELRSLPTNNSLNLMIALFLAQLLYLVNNMFTEEPKACATVAVILHYLFLAAFTWMNVCAFNLYYTFCNVWEHRSGQSDMKHRFIKHLLYGWGAPLFVLLPCLLIEFAKITSFRIGYGGPNACWITIPRMMLYFFGIPVALIILVNIYFFIRTIVAIRESQSSMIKTSTQNKGTRQEMLIYMRITVLMGFTWILPFLAQIHQPYISRIILVVLTEVFNGLQGVFLFLAYIVNRRVWNLYAEKCCSGSGHTKRNTSNTSCNSTVKTNLTITTASRKSSSNSILDYNHKVVVPSMSAANSESSADSAGEQNMKNFSTSKEDINKKRALSGTEVLLSNEETKRL